MRQQNVQYAYPDWMLDGLGSEVRIVIAIHQEKYKV